MKKGQQKSNERAQSTTTLAQLIASIDRAINEEKIDSILSHLSFGKQAILYSALQFMAPQLLTPGSAERRARNRSRALHILREILL
jgi:hypothetical protein